MATSTLSPHDKWLSAFEREPIEALDRLLTGRVYMGKLARNETQELLFRLFQPLDNTSRERLDDTLQYWLEQHWMAAPPTMAAPHWADTLRSAFTTVIRLDLRYTQEWLRDHYIRAQPWLRSLYVSPARDPEAELLRVLALSQRDQRLLTFWMRLCALAEDRPLYHASLGLLGLRKLPDANGQPHGDIPDALFGGMVSLANALHTQAGSRRETEEFWLREARALMGRYPRSQQYWRRRFLPLVKPESAAVDLLGKLDEALPRMIERQKRGERITHGRLWPPSKREFDHIINLIQTRHLAEIRTELERFLSGHRTYAQQTGDAEFLVLIFSRIIQQIWGKDAEWALALVREAFIWAPHNTYLWTHRAHIEAHIGNDTRAIGLLWEAKRKFPENEQIRTLLARFLRDQRQLEVAEAVYRQAIEDFPSNAFCRNGLAEVLRAQDKLSDAEAVYRQAIEDFPSNAFCRNGLAEVLRAQGKLSEAEAVYRQTIEDFPSDAFCRSGLAEVLRAQDKLPDAEAVYRQAIKDFPSDVACRNGLAVVIMQQGNRQEGIQLLEETARDFPRDAVSHGLLQRITGQDTASDTPTTIYDEFSTIVLQKDSTALDDVDFAAGATMVFDQELVEQPDLGDGSGDSDTFGELQDTDQDINIPIKPAFDFMDEGAGAWEADIGLASLYRWVMRRAEGMEREAYLQKYRTACERALLQNPDSLFGLLEKGLGLLDEDPASAEAFFKRQMIEGKQSHVLGFQIGVLQAQLRQGHVVPPEQWQEIMTRFTGRRTLISIENVRQSAPHANGNALSMLENLRQQIQQPTDTLPTTLRANEAWLHKTVQHQFFAQVDWNEPFTEETVPQLLDNIVQNSLIVEGIVERSLAIA